MVIGSAQKWISSTAKYLPDDQAQALWQMMIVMNPDIKKLINDEKITLDECIASFDDQFKDGLPDPSNDPFYSPQNQARLEASIEQMERTGGTVHEVILDD